MILLIIQYKNYGTIINLCNTNPALRDGEFYDLHFYNRNNQYEGYSNRIYAFLRYNENIALLVLINFDSLEEMAMIKIPEDAWNMIGIKSEKVNLILDNNQQFIDMKSTLDYNTKSQLQVNIPPLDYVIIQITSTDK